MRYILALAAAGLVAQQRTITHEDVWLMKRIGDMALSPDGKRVVFSVVEPAYDPSQTVSDLWIAGTENAAPPRRLTNTKGGESGAAFSPDGGRIAFTAKREGDEVAQVYAISLSGGEALRVTEATADASNPRWRPDGKAILYESAVGVPAKTKYNARTFDAFPVRFWNAWLDGSRPHLFVRELTAAARAHDILDGSALAKSKGFAGIQNPLAGGQGLDAAWCPDGSCVVFAAVVNRDETMTANTESHLFAVPAGGGEPRRLTDSGHSYAEPAFSPDGSALYALQERSPKPGSIYSLSRLARWAWPSGKMEIATGAWNRSVSSFTVDKDGTVYIACERDGKDELFRIDKGKVVQWLGAEEGGFSMPRAAGGIFVAKHSSSRRPYQIVRADQPDSLEHPLAAFDTDRLKQLKMEPLEHFWFTAKNGKRIHNVLAKPPNFDPAKKYPLVVFPHGGPNAMSKDDFSVRWNTQYLVSPGYVMLQTNYTGSTGFGEKFADDIERDVLRGPAQEILEAIDAAIQKYPFIDRSRQAAIGASYGGYLMNWFNGHTRQFRALVNHAGAVNNESQYGVNDGGWGRELRMGPPIWERGGQWMDQSPIRYSQNFRTPMLITQGELDFRVPLSESMTTFKLLQRLKVPTRLIVFPEEGHWILRGENSRHHMDQVMAWLKTYLDPEKPVWP
jgi:dipeptidyl aminopeptidase/acylaminoacyl peptidase